MDDHGYDQAACRRAAELLRDQAEQVREAALDTKDTGLREALGAQSRAFVRGSVKPLTLRRFREQIEEQPDLFDPFDVGGCGCCFVDQEDRL